MREAPLYLYRRYDARRILECIRKEEITFMHGSPTVYGKMMDFKEEYPELPSLKAMACGSSYMPVEKMKEFHRWLPDTKFQVIYGMTETSSPALIFPGDVCQRVCRGGGMACARYSVQIPG